MDRHKFFDTIAQEWEKENRISREKEKLEGLCANFSLSRGDKVLDMGCGTGRLVSFLHNAIGERGILVESDFSREMLKIGKAKYIQKNLCFIQANAEIIPFRESFFDAIICFALFPHIPDKAKALKEFHRSLKPGKPLFIAHLMSREELNCFHLQVKGPVARDLLPSREEMEGLFSSAGFRNLTIRDEPSLYTARGLA